MRIKPELLEGTLEKKLAAVYFLTGDEPLQLGEAADLVRSAAKKQGYLLREVYSVESGFEWNELAIAADSYSIFADKKVIDLRLSHSKPGIEGAKALALYCQRLPEDTLLLITAPKLDKASLKTKWFQSIDQAGVVSQVWPLDGADLIQWLQKRAKNRGLQIEADGIRALASRVEGNLLSASQEIEKLYVLCGKTALSRQEIEEKVADSARFDVFKLTDCVLSGRVTRMVKILNGLKMEGIAAPVVLWALARETRMLIKIKIALNHGQRKDSVFNTYRLWDKRKQLVDSVQSRMSIKEFQEVILLSSKADRQIKGQEQGDCWETLLSICLLYSTPKQRYIK